MPRGREKQFDRSVALARAMELFWERGYEATSLSDLLEHMQIGRQSLYDTFGDKHSLFVEALRVYMAEQAGEFLAALKGSGSPLTRVKRLVKKWQDFAAEGECHGCFAANSCAEFGTRDPAVSLLIQNQARQIEDTLTDVLTEAREAGELAPTSNPRALARSLMAMSIGMMMLAKMGAPKAMLRDAAAGALDLLCSGKDADAHGA